MPNKKTVAQIISEALEASGKTQRQVAQEVGFANPSVMAMLKGGFTKVPLERIVPLADALGIERWHFYRAVLSEYHPALLAMLDSLYSQHRT